MKSFILQFISFIKHRNLDILFQNEVDVKLNSSAIKTVSYNKDTQELVVNFTHGGVYKYDSIRPVVFYELLANKSSGQFFVKEIRNSYHFAKIV